MMTQRWTWRLGDAVTCYRIDADGRRGRSVELHAVPDSASSCAILAAQAFDEAEKAELGIDDCRFDGLRRVIEVVGVYDRPMRFRVTTRVVRTYDVKEAE